MSEVVDCGTGEVVPYENSGGVIVYDQKTIQLLKDTVAKGTTGEEFRMFLAVCKHTGLDPFMKQIYIIKRWDSQLQREVATPQTSIDGFRSVAEDTGEYAGCDEPTYGPIDDKGFPEWAKATIYRIVIGQRVAFSATAYWSEYVQLKKDGSIKPMWVKMPRTMLAKCAETLALRKGFPRKLSKLYTPEEMGQAENPIVGESDTPQSHSYTGEGVAPISENDIVSFGKHKGKRWSEVDDNYLGWLAENGRDEKIKSQAKNLLDSRNHRGDENQPDPDLDIPITDKQITAIDNLMKDRPDGDLAWWNTIKEHYLKGVSVTSGAELIKWLSKKLDAPIPDEITGLFEPKEEK